MTDTIIFVTKIRHDGNVDHLEGSSVDPTLAQSSSFNHAAAWLFTRAGAESIDVIPESMPEIAIGRDATGDRVTLYNGMPNVRPPLLDTIVQYAENRVIVSTTKRMSAVPSFLAPLPNYSLSSFDLDVRMLVKTYADIPDFQANMLYNVFISRVIGATFNSNSEQLLHATANSAGISVGSTLPVEFVDPGRGRSVYGALQVVQRYPGHTRARLFLSENVSTITPGTILRRSVRWKQEDKILQRQADIAHVVCQTAGE